MNAYDRLWDKKRRRSCIDGTPEEQLRWLRAELVDSGYTPQVFFNAITIHLILDGKAATALDEKKLDAIETFENSVRPVTNRLIRSRSVSRSRPRTHRSAALAGQSESEEEEDDDEEDGDDDEEDGDDDEEDDDDDDEEKGPARSGSGSTSHHLDDHIDIDSFETGLTLLRLHCNREHATRLFQYIGPDEAGYITWSKLQSFCFPHLQHKYLKLSLVSKVSMPTDLCSFESVLQWTRNQIRLRRLSSTRLFSMMDADIDGSIDLVEFHRGLNLAGIRCTVLQARHLFEYIDNRGEGNLTWNDIHETLNPHSHRSASKQLEKAPKCMPSLAPDFIAIDQLMWLQNKMFENGINPRKLFNCMTMTPVQIHAYKLHKNNNRKEKKNVISLCQFHRGLFLLGIRTENNEDSDLLPLFNEIDKDKDGEIEWNELRQLLLPDSRSDYIRPKINIINWKSDKEPLTIIQFIRKELMKRKISIYHFFNTCDCNNDQSIRLVEFVRGLNLSGIHCEKKHVAQIFEYIDNDYDNHIELDELKIALRPTESKSLIVAHPKVQAAWVSAILDNHDVTKTELWSVMDNDHDGVVNIDEFSFGLRTFGIRCTKYQAEPLFLYLWSLDEKMKMKLYNTNTNQENEEEQEKFEKFITKDALLASFRPIDAQVKTRRLLKKQIVIQQLQQTVQNQKKAFGGSHFIAPIDGFENGDSALDRFKRFNNESRIRYKDGSGITTEDVEDMAEFEAAEREKMAMEEARCRYAWKAQKALILEEQLEQLKRIQLRRINSKQYHLVEAQRRIERERLADPQGRMRSFKEREEEERCAMEKEEKMLRLYNKRKWKTFALERIERDKKRKANIKAIQEERDRKERRKKEAIYIEKEWKRARNESLKMYEEDRCSALMEIAIERALRESVFASIVANPFRPFFKGNDDENSTFPMLTGGKSKCSHIGNSKYLPLEKIEHLPLERFGLRNLSESNFEKRSSGKHTLETQNFDMNTLNRYLDWESQEERLKKTKKRIVKLSKKKEGLKPLSMTEKNVLLRIARESPALLHRVPIDVVVAADLPEAEVSKVWNRPAKTKAFSRWRTSPSRQSRWKNLKRNSRLPKLSSYDIAIPPTIFERSTSSMVTAINESVLEKNPFELYQKNISEKHDTLEESMGGSFKSYKLGDKGSSVLPSNNDFALGFDPEEGMPRTVSMSESTDDFRSETEGTRGSSVFSNEYSNSANSSISLCSQDFYKRRNRKAQRRDISVSTEQESVDVDDMGFMWDDDGDELASSQLNASFPKLEEESRYIRTPTRETTVSDVSKIRSESKTKVSSAATPSRIASSSILSQTTSISKPFDKYDLEERAEFLHLKTLKLKNGGASSRITTPTMNEQFAAKNRKMYEEEISREGTSSVLNTFDLSLQRNLTSLHLFAPSNPGAVTSRYRYLRELDVSDCDFLVDISDIAHCTVLRTLSMARCTQLRDISAVGMLGQLQMIDLTGCVSLQTISSLGRCLHLERINLSNCISLKNIEGLEKCRELHTVSLSKCFVESLHPLIKCRKLTHLDLRGCTEKTDLSSLKDCTRLTKLNCSQHKELKDTSFLSQCFHLQALDLSECSKLTEIDSLRSLKELRILDLSNCKMIRTPEPLNECIKLHTLIVAGCDSLLNLNGLGKCPELCTLNCNECESLNDLTGLMKAPVLYLLELGYCKNLVDISPLTTLPVLHTLNLSSCTPGLKNVSKLAQCGSLRRLKLSGCINVKDMNALSLSQSLVRLDIRGCTQLKYATPLAGCLTLRRIDIRGCSNIVDVKMLREDGGIELAILVDAEIDENEIKK
eukprot:g1876.t1